MASGSPSPAPATLTCRLTSDRVTKPVGICGTQETSLGNALRARFAQAGDPADLGRAVGCHRAAVADLREGAPDAAIWLAMYGHALHDRYAHEEDERDLAECAEVYARAAARATGGDQDHILSGQGTVSIERYRRGGDAAHLQAALDLYSRALAACSPAAPQRGVYLSDLGTAYRLRYLNTGQLRDLERAIASMDEAIALTEPNAPNWGALLTTRGMLASTRTTRPASSRQSARGSAILRTELAALTADIQAEDNDIGNAIDLLESALSLTPGETAMRPQHMGALGDARLSRYRRTGQGGLADRLARAYRLRWTYRHDDDDLHRSVEMYERASRPGRGQGQARSARPPWNGAAGRWTVRRGRNPQQSGLRSDPGPVQRAGRPSSLSILRRSRLVGRPVPRSRAATATSSSRGGGGGLLSM